MMDFQATSNSPKIAAIHIHLGCLFSHTGGVALCFGLRRVLAIAIHTPVPLRTCVRFARFVLAGRFVAMWTSFHSPILAHPFSHSLHFVLPSTLFRIRVTAFTKYDNWEKRVYPKRLWGEHQNCGAHLPDLNSHWKDAARSPSNSLLLCVQDEFSVGRLFDPERF